MQVPSILQGESLTRLLQGIATGAVATLVICFYWGGWVTGGTAKEIAQKSADSAVVLALAPICVNKFQHQADATTNLTELKKISSYEQGSFIEKGGWATMPGATSPDSAVAQACEVVGPSLRNGDGYDLLPATATDIAADDWRHGDSKASNKVA